MRSDSVHCIQAVADFVDFDARQGILVAILLVFHLFKNRGHVRFYKLPKQDYEFDSCEMFTVEVYENRVE